MEPPESSLQQSAPEAYEAEHVHEVYEQIAAHFSSTRYKPWPIVESFLKKQPDGSVGLDVGCGNGKYLTVNPKIFILGSDRSPTLAKIASQHEPHSAVVADALTLPHPDSRFDFVISIAVIHHLSTASRRTKAIRAILDALKPSDGACSTRDRPRKEMPSESGGKALIYVWALEQRESRRGWDEGCEQDVMVPWVMKGKPSNATQGYGKEGQKKVVSHMHRRKHGPRDEGRKTKEDSRLDVEEMYSGVPSPTKISKQGPSIRESRELETPGEGNSLHGEEKDAETTRTFQRYYHLYRSGELERDIIEAGGRVVDSGYEKDNWWAIATCD